MNIRRAVSGDIPAILSLLRQVGGLHHEGRPDLFKKGTKYTEETLLPLLGSDSSPIFVAEEGGSVLGHLFCRFESTPEDSVHIERKTLYIDDLCVDESARGKHVGRALMDFARDFARSSGCYNLTLFVWSFNETALRFYEGLGMAPQKICMEEILEESR